ncbi:MAG: dipeptidase PepE [Chloroflexota bacterium]|nr:dipeptidase PepE [Dehalococcoidia bacterium]MDW8253842.1 dipeptidase PepE [Chloroflexota bacterium]
MDLLLFSGGDMRPYRDRVLAEIRASLGGATTLYFAPWALAQHDAVTARVQEAFAPPGVTVIGLHRVADPRAALAEAQALFVGGGNTFRLLKALQTFGLLDLVRRRVEAGDLRYIGASAGANVACPSIRTTNDMPIVQPSSFEALGLLPFQINPHYVEGASSPGGETRDMRIAEFLEENDVAVLGLREGSWLRRRDRTLRLEGVAGAKLFRRGHDPVEVAPGTDLSWLLALTPRFDVGA